LLSSEFFYLRTQNQCRLGLRPRPYWRAYSAPSDPLAGFKGPLRGRRGMEECREVLGEGEGQVRGRGMGNGGERGKVGGIAP